MKGTLIYKAPGACRALPKPSGNSSVPVPEPLGESRSLQDPQKVDNRAPSRGTGHSLADVWLEHLTTARPRGALAIRSPMRGWST